MPEAARPSPVEARESADRKIPRGFTETSWVNLALAGISLGFSIAYSKYMPELLTGRATSSIYVRLGAAAASMSIDLMGRHYQRLTAEYAWSLGDSSLEPVLKKPREPWPRGDLPWRKEVLSAAWLAATTGFWQYTIPIVTYRLLQAKGHMRAARRNELVARQLEPEGYARSNPGLDEIL